MIIRPALFLRHHAPIRLPFFFLLMAVFFAMPQTQSYAATAILIDADTQYDFAEQYYARGDYARAVDEYKRFVYFFPGDDRVERALFQCGMAFYSGRRYAEAVAAFHAVIDQFKLSELAVKSYFMISESHIRQNQYAAAIINLNNLIAVTKDADVRDRANYRLGWIYIDTASWDSARLYFEKISPPNRDKFRLERLSAELSQAAGISRKNPALAGVLSIVPGVGQIYCERYQDALISFLLNGALIWATVEAFDNDNTPLGALLAIVEAGFYSGNIYGAVGSAHKYNRSKTEQFIENLKTNAKINLSGDLESKSVRLSLRLTF